jgi:hypothetical protein
MTRAAIYVRVSTARQAEHDLSLPDQVTQCRQYCEREGWEVAEIFSEPGASALDENRPSFQEMIYKATRIDRPYDIVVVHSLSRFSRDPPDLRQAYARLLLREVSVDDEEIHICGSKAILARTAAEGPASRTPAVLSFVREWCTGEDSNLCLPDSESDLRPFWSFTNNTPKAVNVTWRGIVTFGRTLNLQPHLAPFVEGVRGKSRRLGVADQPDIDAVKFRR